MSITDELREYAGSFYLFRYKDVREKLDAIADRIDQEADEEAARKYLAGFDEGFASADDWMNMNEDDLSKHGWVKLPVDADGVPIRVGDVMESKGSGLLFGKASFEVRSMRCDECGWEVYDRLGDRYAPSLLRHYHAPTVEDVLTEFGIDWEHESDCEDRAALLKEYAAKLQLREDA